MIFVYIPLSLTPEHLAQHTANIGRMRKYMYDTLCELEVCAGHSISKPISALWFSKHHL
jgi:hypothetical protein